MDTRRLEEIEIKCAHLERAVQELSDVVYRQQQQLDRMLQRNQDLTRQVEALEAATEVAGGPRPKSPILGRERRRVIPACSCPAGLVRRRRRWPRPLIRRWPGEI